MSNSESRSEWEGNLKTRDEFESAKQRRKRERGETNRRSLALCAMWMLFGFGASFSGKVLDAVVGGNWAMVALFVPLWILPIVATVFLFYFLLGNECKRALKFGHDCGQISTDFRIYSIYERIIRTLAISNDRQTVLDRIKYSLALATLPFVNEVYTDFTDEKMKEREKNNGGRFDNTELKRGADLIIRMTKLVWRPNPDGQGDYSFTEGFKNCTPEFLDAIGIPRDERDSLWKRSEAMFGTCVVCGKVITDLDVDEGDMFYRGEEDDDGTPKELVCHDCFSKRAVEENWNVKSAREKVEKERAERAKENGKEGDAK